MSLIVAQQEILEPGQRTLEELAASANAAHRQTVDSLINALQHAIKAGDALLEARQRFSPEKGQGWLAWCDDNIEMSSTTIGKYIRLAYYKHILPQELLDAPYNHNTPGLTVALEYLRGLPKITEQGRTRAFDWDEARRLKASGLNNQQIAELLGVARGTVRRAVMSASERRKFDARKKRMKAARERAHQRAQIERLNAPPDLADAYALIRKALQRVQAAHDSTKTSERGGLAHAISSLHRAEDAVARAIKEQA